MTEPGEWVTDPNALLTIFALQGVRVGDYLRAVSPEDGSGEHEALIGTKDSEEFVNTAYNNPQLSNAYWRIIGWRRP